MYIVRVHSLLPFSRSCIVVPAADDVMYMCTFKDKRAFLSSLETRGGWHPPSLDT